MTTAAADAPPMLEIPEALIGEGFALRPETDGDVPFLRRLYASTRWEELAPVIDWSDAQKVAFLESQFAFQRHHYRTYYPNTDWLVLELQGTPVGRIYLERQADPMIMMDIALLPEWRGRGVGTALITAALGVAREAGRAMSITVEKFNPAQRLYRRLGFREVADEGVHWIMEWRAGAAAPT